MEQITPAEPVRLANLGAVVAIRSSINGALTGLSIINNQAAAITLGTTVPTFEFNVAASVSLVPALAAGGMRFRNGLQIASSTTEGGATPSAVGVFVFALVT
jgi:hypothetical protein